MQRKADAELRAKELRAVQLRAAGKTYKEIADTGLYANASGAQKAVKRCLDRDICDAVDDIQKQEITRIDQMITGLWPAARTGHVRSVEAVARLMDQRTKYVPGLAVPTEIKATVETVTRDDFKTFLAGAAEAFALKELDKQREAKEIKALA